MNDKLPSTSEVTAVFDSAGNLEEAVDDLLSSGFDRAEVSLLGNEGLIDGQLGHFIRRDEDGAVESRSVYVSDEETGQARKLITGTLAAVGGMAGGAAVVATGGAIAPAFLAALMAGGATGLAGDAATRAIARERRDELEKRLDEGGVVLFVAAADADREQKAVEVLSRHSAHEVTSHVVEPGSV